MLARLAIWLIFRTGLDITPENHSHSILFLTHRAFSCTRFLSERMHALLVPFLVGLPNNFLDAVSYPEDVVHSTEGIFFLLLFTPQPGVIPPIRPSSPSQARGITLVKPFLLPELKEVRGLTHHSPAVSSRAG